MGCDTCTTGQRLRRMGAETRIAAHGRLVTGGTAYVVEHGWATRVAKHALRRMRQVALHARLYTGGGTWLRRMGG